MKSRCQVNVFLSIVSIERKSEKDEKVKGDEKMVKMIVKGVMFPFNKRSSKILFLLIKRKIGNKM